MLQRTLGYMSDPLFMGVILISKEVMSSESTGKYSEDCLCTCTFPGSASLSLSVSLSLSFSFPSSCFLPPSYLLSLSLSFPSSLFLPFSFLPLFQPCVFNHWTARDRFLSRRVIRYKVIRCRCRFQDTRDQVPVAQ